MGILKISEHILFNIFIEFIDFKTIPGQ